MVRDSLLATEEKPRADREPREPAVEDGAHAQLHGLWISPRIAASAGILYVVVMTVLFLATPALEKWMCLPWAPIYHYFF